MKRSYGVVTVGLAGVLLLSGCGSSKSSTASSATTTTAAAAKGAADTGASALRATLTAQLQEHVYLAGDATGDALAGDTTGYTNAAAALDANSVDLSKSIASVYGDAAGTQFLALWRKHIGFFVDYTNAKAKNDAAALATAKAALDGYRADFGAFIAAANPNLTKDAVATELVGHVQTLEAAIDAQAAKDPNAYALLKTAAAHMPGTADVLAGAIVKQYPDKFAGTESGGAAVLRSGLTAQLQEHVYLAADATSAALGGNTAGFNAAAAALDTNSVDLSKSIASVYGDAAGTQFLALWRKHIGFFVDYTQGKAAKDDAKVATAKAALDGYRADFGAFIAAANPNLTKDAVATELVGHVNTLEAVIDAQAAKSNDQYTLTRTAAAHMPMTADVLAGAIAKQYPDKFGA